VEIASELLGLGKALVCVEGGKIPINARVHRPSSRGSAPFIRNRELCRFIWNSLLECLTRSTV
jgi:hypothetical protein